MEQEKVSQQSPAPEQNTQLTNANNHSHSHVPTIVGVVLLLIIVGGGAYYLGTQKNQSKTTMESSNNSISSTPIPTSQVTTAPISNGTTQQGEWTIKYIQKSQMDVVQDVHLINSKTNEDKIIGQTYVIAPGEHAVFSNDFSQVIFLGAINDGDKLTSESISFYSISQNKVTKTITLGDIKSALPSLVIPRNAALNSLILSPSGNKIAMSYGYTYELDSGSDIIVIDLTTYKISTVSAKGVLKGWKNDTTLQYQVTESTPNNEQINIVTKEVLVP